MTDTQYRIPAQTEDSKALVTAAREALAADDTLTVESALALDVQPKDDGASAVKAAEEALKASKRNAQTFARLRFDAVALAYSTGRVGKGQMYPNQRVLAKALGMTQGRVSQILKAQTEAERVSAARSALKAAAKAGGVADVDGLSQTVQAIATDGTPEEVAAAVQAFEAGRIPSGPARTLDTDRLVQAAERVLTLSGDVIDVSADRDAVERVIAMLTTARGNLTSALKTAPAIAS